MMIAHRNIDVESVVEIVQEERINAIHSIRGSRAVIGLEVKVDHPLRQTFPNQVGPFRQRGTARVGEENTL